MPYYLWSCFLLVCACSTAVKTPYQQKIFDYQEQGKVRPSQEIRALWVVRSEIKTKENIERVIAKMQEYHLNTAIVQVRGLSDVLYSSKIEPLADEIAPDLADPLQYFIEQARPVGIAVQAWVNVNMLSKPEFLANFSQAERHLVVQKPEWVLRDETGRSMLDYKTEELEADWMDGAYANPAHPAWRSYFLGLIDEIQNRYNLQGIHLDFIRYPNAQHGKKIFGLDEEHLGVLQKSLPFSAQDYLEYPQYQPALEVFKMAMMHQFVKEIYERVKRNNPQHLLSAAVWAHREKTLKSVFQDWPFWLKKGFLDQAFAMIYVTDAEVHDRRMEEFFAEEYSHKLVIGIGLYRQPKMKTIARQIDSARAIGAAGFCFFSAKNLLDPQLEQQQPSTKIKDYLAPEDLRSQH